MLSGYTSWQKWDIDSLIDGKDLPVRVPTDGPGSYRPEVIASSVGIFNVSILVSIFNPVFDPQEAAMI